MIGIQGANPNFVDDVQARTATSGSVTTVVADVPDRRRFLLRSVAGLLMAPGAARAQLTADGFRIAVLGATRAEDLPALDGFRRGLRERGYIEGENLAIEYRWAHGRFERLPNRAAELVALKPRVFVALVTQASLAARRRQAPRRSSWSPWPTR
jgi:hypothetical protein